MIQNFLFFFFKQQQSPQQDLAVPEFMFLKVPLKFIIYNGAVV